MPIVTAGNQEFNLDEPKRADGRSAINAVIDGLGLMPGQKPLSVETVVSGEHTEPGKLDANQQTHQEEPPEPTVFDLKAHGDELVEVQIDGQVVMKKLSDITQGYMRHADYTRKTQQLAEERRNVEQGISPEEKQLLEVGKIVASNPDARAAVQEVLQSQDQLDPEAAQARRIAQLEEKLNKQQRNAAAEKQLQQLVEKHPESQAHLSDIVAEMKRTGSRDPVATWRSLDYENVPERLKEADEAARLAKAKAAEEQSVVNTPSGGSTAVTPTEEVPTKDERGFALSGRNYVLELAKSLAA